MKKYLESIRPFFISSICYIVLLFCVKLFELSTAESLKVIDVINMLLSNLIAALSVGFCVFIIHNLISLFSRKIAPYITSILFSILIIVEFCLIFYHKTTGLLMGRELIERPLWETVHTVKSVLNFWMITAVVLFVVGYTYVSMRIVNRQQSTDLWRKQLKAQ